MAGGLNEIGIGCEHVFGGEPAGVGKQARDLRRKERRRPEHFGRTPSAMTSPWLMSTTVGQRCGQFDIMHHQYDGHAVRTPLLEQHHQFLLSQVV